MTTKPLSLSVALVELRREVNVKFDVQKLLDEFPEEWAAWQADGDPDDPGNDDVEGFVRETIAAIGWDLLDYDDWVVPDPTYDDSGTNVRFRDA